MLYLTDHALQRLSERDPLCRSPEQIQAILSAKLSRCNLRGEWWGSVKIPIDAELYGVVCPSEGQICVKTIRRWREGRRGREG
jgi:hypothetical protein